MGDAPTIYSRLKKVAKPHLVHYRTDLTVHDRALSRNMMPGDAAIYAVRESGTHMAFFRLGADTGEAKAYGQAKLAIDYLDAILVSSPVINWYLIECTSPQRGTVTPISFTEARLMVMEQRDRMKAVLDRQRRRAA